ncbi:unnamed protein product [Ascophyllum nodosum]
MSVVKTVKSRRALLTALDQTPKDKLRWWDHKQRILEQWLDTHGDEIAVEGASELIRGQLVRGEKHEHLRIKCWKHIVIELSALVEDDTAASNGASAVMAARRSSHRETDNLSSSPDNDRCEAVDLSGLSFVERQEKWLQRRQLSLRAKAQEVEKAAKDAASFNPNLAISQSSLKPAQVSAVEHKLEEMANEAQRQARRCSFSQSIQESKQRTEKEMVPPCASISGTRRRSRMKRRSSAAIGGVGPRRATAPPTAFQDQNDSSGQLNPVGDSNSDDDPEESAYGAARTSQRPEVDGDHKTEAMEADLAAGENGVDEEGRQESKSVAGGGDKEPPFPQGSFFFKVDNKDKGHYRVRDVSCFLLTSMYKRKDRVTRTPGVSLLVGKLEHPPHEEKVISALFDTDRFSERAAAQWWEDNGHRFEDASSLAEKKELDGDRRRTMERNNAVLRRVSAPV